MPHHHRPTTVAILGADTVVENALTLLLGGAGYSTKVLAEGAGRGWKLISAIKRPEADVLLVTWDTSGDFSG